MYVWAPGVNTENKVLKKKFLPSKSNNDNIKKLYTFGGLKLFESFIVENLNTIDTHTQTQTQDSYGSFFLILFHIRSISLKMMMIITLSGFISKKIVRN